MKLTILLYLSHLSSFSLSQDLLYENVRKNDILFEKNQLLGRCIGAIAAEYFWRTQYVAVVLVTGNRNRCEVLADNQQQGIVNQIVRAVGKRSALFIVNDPDVGVGETCENYIIITDTSKTFQDSIPDIPAKKYSHSGRVVVLVTNPPKLLRRIQWMIRDILKTCWENDIVNVALIVVINGVPRLYTYFPFLEGKCRNSDAVLINTWEEDSWTKGDIYPPKASQMNGCELRVSLVARTPHTMISYKPNGEIQFYGIEANLLRMLGSLVNFTILEFEPKDRLRWGHFNGTAWTGVAGDLVYRRADIGAGANIPSLAKTQILDISVGYDTVYLVWAIPRFEKYSPFIKMLLPFKYKLWICFGFTLFGLLVLFKFLMFYFNHVTVRAKFVAMAIWQITFGYPVDFMPPGRFASYVFTVWIWTSMVLRNSYQGELVGFLTSTFYADGVSNMKDLIEQDFNLYGLPSGLDYIKNVTDDETVKKVYQRIIMLKNMEELDAKTVQMYNTNEKSAVFAFTSHVNEINYKQNISVQELQETYRSQTITLAYKKYTVYSKAFDNWILHISEAGFIEQWVDDFSFPQFEPDNDPVQIKLKHLLLPFVLLLFGECVSLFIFFGEILHCKKYFESK